MERYIPLFVVKVENGMEWNGMERRFADLCSHVFLRCGEEPRVAPDGVEVVPSNPTGARVDPWSTCKS